MRRSLRLLYFAVILLAMALAGWHRTQLPARVATHFDLAGHANGWMSANAYLAFQLGLLLLLGALFDQLGRLLRRLPDGLVNIPHRDYWLVPGRREQTWRWLDDALRTLGIATVAFCTLLFQKVYAANLAGVLQLKMLPFIIGWFVFVLCLAGVMTARFQRPDETKPRRRR